MARTHALLLRPAATVDYRLPPKHRRVGIGLAIIGVGLATVTLINNVVAGSLVAQGGQEAVVGRLQAWSFGLTTLAFGVLKVGIAVVLIGILGRLWMRVDSVKAVLPFLRAVDRPEAPVRPGDIDTPYGKATVSTGEPEPLFVHRMARLLWAPMLVMGAMLVAIGFAVSVVQTGAVVDNPVLARSQSAWVQGLQFLGEGALLSGISFLLGSILSAMRTGGGEVQESLGVAVKTLKMPLAAKLFVALMMLGLAVEMLQFVLYAVAANLSDATAVTALFTWLGPLREVGLGLLLSGIVLALATIAKALAFQFDRITEIIATGN